MSFKGFTTRILHADRGAGTEHGAVHQPIHTSAAFGYARASDLVDVFQNKRPGFAYSRQNNPTVAALERQVTVMEEGVGTICFATGMAAVAALAGALLKKGDQVVASTFLFGNTTSLFLTLEQMGLEVRFADVTDVKAVAAAVTDRTRMVFTETIANPVTQVADLAGIGDLCAERNIPLVIDNTMTGPYLFRPKRVKAAFSLNSLTKTIGGHGDGLGGSLTDLGNFPWKKFPNIRDAWRGVEEAQQALTQVRKNGLRDFGGTLSADVAHRLSIGAETLALRLERSCANARALASFLETHPRVKKVNYPGLATHPQFDRANALFSQPGTILSFEPADGLDACAVLDRMDLVVSSTNLGDTRTLGIPVASTIYHELGAARRKDMGIGENLIRISVGIEDWGDLKEAFTAGLAG